MGLVLMSPALRRVRLCTFLFLAACHQRPVVTLAPDAPRVGVVVDSDRSPGTAPSAVASDLRAAVARELAEHGYAAATTPPVAATLHLSTETDFFAQVAGRYRWTVRVRATLDRPGSRVENTWDIPVFMVYDHERDDDAVRAAIPSIERHLDAWLADALPRSPAAPE